MENVKVISNNTPKAGDRRQRNFAIHVTPKPTFFENVSLKISKKI
jgi:hypothetical protein